MSYPTLPSPSRRRLRSGGAALALAGLALASTAHAQTPPPPPPIDAASLVTLKPVVITARHRAERAQRVPVSLTTVSARQITTVGSSNLAKLQQLVPSLTVEAFNPRNTSLNIRGLGAVPNLANDGLEGGVGVYLDGVLLARPAQDVFDLPDLQDIEVLRGPQGTLFGKNTVAGAVNITTRLPSFTPEADGSVSYGSNHYAQVKASVSGPVLGTDKVAVRLSIQGTQHAGYVEDTADGRRFGDQDDKGVRLQILANATPELTLRAIFDYSHQKEDCCVNLLIGTVNGVAGNGVPIASVLPRYANLGYTPYFNPFDRNTNVDSPVYYDMETGGGSLQADYDLNGFILTSISAVRYWNWYPHNDIDDTALPISTASNATVYQRQVSQELRVTSPLGGPVDYTGGLYYFYQSLDGQLFQSFGSAIGAYVTDTSPGSAAARTYDTALNGFAQDSNGVYDTHSLAGYGQATWHVLPKFDVTGGIRYTYEYKTGAYDEVQEGGVATSSPAVLAIRKAYSPLTSYTVSTDDSLPAGLVTLSYKPSDDILGYLTYSHGSKSAGVNLISSAVAPKIVAPESIDNFELGLKNTLLDGRLLLDGDLFWEEDKDYQSTLIGATPGGATYSYVASVPKVRSRGVELDSQAQVTAGLSLFASGVFDDGSYESNPKAPCPIEYGGPAKSCDLTGRPIAGVSEWTGSLGGEYDRPLPEISGRALVAYAAANLLLKSGFYSQADDSRYSLAPGYGVGNVDFGVKAADGRWDLAVWVRNFTNARYYLYRAVSGQFPTYNLIAGQVGDPISGGVTLAGHF